MRISRRAAAILSELQATQTIYVTGDVVGVPAAPKVESIEKRGIGTGKCIECGGRISINKNYHRDCKPLPMLPVSEYIQKLEDGVDTPDIVEEKDGQHA